MRRSIPIVLFVIFVLLAAPAAALATDDDIPGTALTLGVTASGQLTAADVYDVHAVDLTAGQEVYIRFDPGNVFGPAGNIHLFVPGASSLAEAELYSEMNFQAVGGVPYQTKRGAYFYYVPAKTGTYYLCAEWAAGTLDYKLTVTRTSRAALDLAPDADGLPGTPLTPGTVTGVVSTRGDLYDVYSLTLTAGQTAGINLIPLTPFDNYWPYTARVSLLDPSTGSVAQASTHILAGPAGAVHARDDAANETGVLQYTAATTGTYYVLVQCGPFVDPGSEGGMDFPYQLTVTAGGAAPGAGGFSDVAGSPYETAILNLSGRGIITGFEDGTFRPNAPVTRQQFAKMIVKTLGLAVSGNEVCPFTDVATQTGTDPNYPSKYVAVCALHAITTGKTATTFAPGENITRQQLITMLARAVSASLSNPPTDYVAPFTSGQFSLSEHYQNARKAAFAGLLEGLQGVGSSYSFGAAATRGECSQLLHNLLNLGP